LLIQAALSILKPLGIIQYGPEQVKFIKYRPVLDNSKIKQQFNHQPRYTSEQALDAYLQLSSTDVEQ
jgi:UDP-glucose 4-epimerase